MIRDGARRAATLASTDAATKEFLYHLTADLNKNPHHKLALKQLLEVNEDRTHPFHVAWEMLIQHTLSIPLPEEMQEYHSLRMGKPDIYFPNVSKAETPIQFATRVVNVKMILTKWGPEYLIAFNNTQPIMNVFIKGLGRSWER